MTGGLLIMQSALDDVPPCHGPCSSCMISNEFCIEAEMMYVLQMQLPRNIFTYFRMKFGCGMWEPNNG